MNPVEQLLVMASALGLPNIKVVIREVWGQGTEVPKKRV